MCADEHRAILAELTADPSRVADLDPADVPDLLASLEALRGRLWARLHAGRDTEPAPDPTPRDDRLMDAGEVADRLGVDKGYVYDHHDDWPFTRRISPRKLRFSERGLASWMETRP